MARFTEDEIDHLIQLCGVYDGWSIAVLKDGRRINRWANDDNTGPEPGYERRYEATQRVLDGRGEDDGR